MRLQMSWRPLAADFLAFHTEFFFSLCFIPNAYFACARTHYRGLYYFTRVFIITFYIMSNCAARAHITWNFWRAAKATDYRAHIPNPKPFPTMLHTTTTHAYNHKHNPNQNIHHLIIYSTWITFIFSKLNRPMSIK